MALPTSLNAAAAIVFRARAADNARARLTPRQPCFEQNPHAGKRKDQIRARLRERACARADAGSQVDPDLAGPRCRLDGARQASTDAQKAWVDAHGLKGSARKHVLLPGADGRIAGVVLWLGEARAGDPMDRAELAVGALPGVLPPGRYRLAERRRGRRACRRRLGPRRLSLPPLQERQQQQRRGHRRPRHSRAAPTRPRARHRRGRRLGRDLINTPAGDLGPAGAGSCRARASPSATARTFASIVGDDLLAAQLPHDPRRRPRQPRARRA